MTCGMSRLRLENHLYTTPSTPILKVQETAKRLLLKAVNKETNRRNAAGRNEAFL